MYNRHAILVYNHTTTTPFQSMRGYQVGGGGGETDGRGATPIHLAFWGVTLLMEGLLFEEMLGGGYKSRSGEGLSTMGV